jgi:hypothetical protein
MALGSRRPVVSIVSDAEREALLAWCEGYTVVSGRRELGRVGAVVFGPGGRVAAVRVDGRQSIPVQAIEEVRPRGRTVVVSVDFSPTE